MGAIQDFDQIYIKFKTLRQILLRSNEKGIVYTKSDPISMKFGTDLDTSHQLS